MGATTFESTFRIHDQGVREVADEMAKNGFRHMAIADGPLMEHEFVVRQQRRIDPEKGLMPHDIEAVIGGRKAVLKVFATGDGGEHSSLWRAPGYLLEASRMYPLFIGVVTGSSTRRMLNVFRTTHQMLQAIGTRKGGGIAALVQTQDLFNGQLQTLIEQGGGIANPKEAA